MSINDNDIVKDISQLNLQTCHHITIIFINVLMV